MRLHHLTVSAFGPFAGTESVDFDDLNDAGLFLLTGATGAGKSSLLDAVCFALYGSVPGARGAKALKSQHAPPEARPEVVLDFGVRNRRFVVRRSPEWSRPSRRGNGTVAEKPSATLVETTGGAERFVSGRAAEVGLFVSDLMGMTASQFLQVALLPQGEFQTFLRASSQDRHDVLQQLFRTGRFARIEDWVHDHSRDLRDRSAVGHATVQRLVDSVAERCGVPTPDGLCGESLAAAAADGQVLPWAAALLTDATAALAAATAERRTAQMRWDEAISRHEIARRRREEADRRSGALAVLATLADSAAEAEAAETALAAAERAAGCRQLLAVLDGAEAEAAAATRDRGTALLGLTGSAAAALLGLSPGDAPTTADLTARAEDLRARVTRWETLLPREAAAALARRDLEGTRGRLAAAEQGLAATLSRAGEVPGEIASLTERLRAATRCAARRDAVTLSVAAARRRHQAAVAAVAARSEVVDLAVAHLEARDRALTARERRSDLATRRLAGMAAELARQLVDGVPCQVCGNTSHPRPARPAEDAVTDAEEAAAERDVATATEMLEAATSALRAAEHRLQAHLSASDGRDVAAAEAEVDALAASLADADRAALEAAAVDHDLAAARTEQSALAERTTAAAAGVASLRQRMTGLEETLHQALAELAEAGCDAETEPLQRKVAELRELLVAVERTRRRVEAFEHATSRVEELREQVRCAALEQGFPTAAEARAALLDAEEQRRLRGLLDERHRAAVAARVVLEETTAPDTDGTDGTLPGAEGPPALSQLAAALADAEGTALDAARTVHVAEERVEALHTLETRLRSALTAWAPVREEALRAEAMSRLVRGTGQDNQLQTRLSAYVLATRLDQVVAAANERLGHMRDQRYLLRRTDRATRKGARAGLGLEVLDQWTGDSRDPVTLSGGETFVVSLSLALGLADVVTRESGGTEIETLFVDEGFGSLDADTLDDVMDRLDGLRAGGRTVGVVSHVSELCNRIPTQVHVAKGRSGSSVTVTTLVG